MLVELLIGMGVFETSPTALLLLQGMWTRYRPAYVVQFTVDIANSTCPGPLAGVGDLTSTKVDHCTLQLTWTPPYTLQGVPILNYSITIKNSTVGSMKAYTSNYEYLYTPRALGVTDEIVVAAINQLGPGSGVHISVNTSSSGELVSLI